MKGSTGLKKLATAVIAVMMLVPQAAMAYEVGVSPVISNHYANPNPYDPSSGTNNGNVTVYYTLNTDAAITVEILDGATVIRNLGLTGKSAGNNFINWDGKQNGAYVNEGTYKYRLTANNTWGAAIAEGNISVDFAVNPGTAPVITNDYASPTPFDPNTQSTNINYTLNTSATVTVSILDGSTVVRTLNSLSQGAGANSMTWNGQLTNGSNAPEKTYTYSIYANNTYGNDTETGSVTVDYAGQSGTAPNVTNTYASPNPFDPNDETTTIHYTLNTTADVTVTVLDGSSTIETVQSAVSRSAGTYSINWDGRNSSNNPYAEGTYTFRVYATNSSGSDTETGSVTIDYDSSGTCTTPVISSHYVTPTPFDPDKDDARISFNTNTTADITVTIRDNSGVIRTLVDDDSMSSGTHNVYWNGEDDDDDLVEDNTYTYRIYATNNCGSDTEQSTVRVDGSNGGSNDDDFEDDYGNLISDVRVEDALFDPSENERAKLLFDVEEDNVYITVRVIDEDEDIVRSLVTSNDYDESNDNSVYWNGKDADSDIVDDDLYLFKITATKSGEPSEVAYRWLEVDTDGRIIGFPDDNDNGESCAGFTDVDQDNPYCKAVELMKIKGIFTGYEDGTFRLYTPINRAETTKVTLLAIGYSIMKDDGTNLGFWDVVKKAWYMTYLRTAKSKGIINGYPDGAFRPNSTPNKVELLKIFLEGTGINIPYCNAAPYNDTPATAETRWYMNYVCFAANNGLINGDYSGNFNPASPMTRGDVAMLFYNFYVRGLYNDSPNYVNTYGSYNGYPYYY